MNKFFYKINFQEKSLQRILYDDLPAEDTHSAFDNAAFYVWKKIWTLKNQENFCQFIVTSFFSVCLIDKIEVPYFKEDLLSS